MGCCTGMQGWDVTLGCRDGIVALGCREEMQVRMLTLWGQQGTQQVPGQSRGCSTCQLGSRSPLPAETHGAKLAQHPQEGTQQQGNPGCTPGHAKLRTMPANWGAGDEKARNSLKGEGKKEEKKEKKVFPVFPCVSLAWCSPSAHCSVYT